MSDIQNLAVRINPPLKAIEAVAYIDTVELYFRTLPKGIRQQIERAQGRRVRIEPCIRQQVVWGYRVITHQPDKNTIEVLDRFASEHQGTLSRFDLAYDFSNLSKEWFERHAILRWRRTGPMHEEENGTYFIRQKGRKRRSARDLVVYADKPSKITGEIDVTHVELRFYGSAVIKKQGLKSVGDLLTLNPKALFDRHVKLVNFDPDKFKVKVIRKTMKDNPAQSRGSLSDRLERIIQKQGGRVQHFKRGTEISSEVVCLPKVLAWVH